jgi:hypothetical protein
MNRQVIHTIEGSLCESFATPGGTGFLCTRGPRPITDVLECGHIKVSYNGKRPFRKCTECQPGDSRFRKAVISQDKEWLIVVAESVEGWTVQIATAVDDDDPGSVELFTCKDSAADYANDIWSGRKVPVHQRPGDS